MDHKNGMYTDNRPLPEVNEIVWAYHRAGAEAPILIIT